MTFVEMPSSESDDISVQELQCQMVAQKSKEKCYKVYVLSHGYFDRESADAVYMRIQGRRS